MPRFDILVRQLDGPSVRVTLAGEVDFACGDELFDALVAVIDADAVREVEVDLAPVLLLDASAVGVLLAAWNRARCVRVGFRVRGAIGMPLRVLEITGVLGVLGGKS